MDKYILPISIAAGLTGLYMILSPRRSPVRPEPAPQQTQAGGQGNIGAYINQASQVVSSIFSALGLAGNSGNTQNTQESKPTQTSYNYPTFSEEEWNDPNTYNTIVDTYTQDGVTYVTTVGGETMSQESYKSHYTDRKSRFRRDLDLVYRNRAAER